MRFSRKMLAALMVLILAFSALPVAAASANEITVTIDGTQVNFEGQGPIITGNRTLVPVRGVFEALGFYPTWDPEARAATLTRHDYVVVLTIGSNVFTTNGVTHTLDVPAQIIQNRTLLPLRAVLESIGIDDMDWIPETRTVVIGTEPLPTGTAPTITTTTLPAGTIGQAYNQTLQATGTTPIVWVLHGFLPAGISLNTATGALTGTPTAAGTFNFTIHAHNAAGNSSRAFTIIVEQHQLSTITLPNRRVTVTERNAWVADYIAFGGPTAEEREIVRLINIERANHNLVQVTIDDPLMRAARFFAQQASDLSGLHTGTHNFGPYATTATAQRGASANVAVAFGANLRQNAGNWHSSGTISAADLVRSWMGTTATRNYILSPEHRFIGVGQFPGGISYLFMNDRASGTAQQYTVTFRANGGVGTMQDQVFTRGVAQNLRANTFTRSGYVFGGWRSTPSGAAQYTNSQSITVTGNRTLYAVWNRPGTVPVITTTTLPNPTYRVAYNQTLVATGTTPMTWSISAGALPTGLSLNPNTGVISGTPTSLASTTFTFTVRAENATGNHTRSFTMTIQSVAHVTVPNVIGLHHAAAETTLVAAPFNFIVTFAPVRVHHPTIQYGHVVSRTPADSMLLPGTVITLTLSSGPATVTGITVGWPSPTFNVGDAFPSSLTVTANLAGGSTRAATTFHVSGVDLGEVLDTPGAHTVTVTYGEHTQSFVITVLPETTPPPYPPDPGDNGDETNGNDNETDD